ncbi:MAG: DNA ligase [Clostridiales bacterium]|nr:DNA ligase [Clostridiales bacterium]
MGKMSELDSGLEELRKCGEKIIAISEMISAMFSTDDEPADNEPPKEVKANVITLEVVRKVLADKSLSGYRADVKNLITSFGAEKLSDIDSSKYEELLAKAEVIGNAE